MPSPQAPQGARNKPGKGALQAPHAHSGVHTCCGLACARRPASLTSAAAFAEQIRSAASRSLLSRRGQRARPRTPPSAPGCLGDTHGPALRERTNPPAGGGGTPRSLQVGRSSSKVTRRREIPNRGRRRGRRGSGGGHSRRPGQRDVSQATLLTGPPEPSTRFERNKPAEALTPSSLLQPRLRLAVEEGLGPGTTLSRQRSASPSLSALAHGSCQARSPPRAVQAPREHAWTCSANYAGRGRDTGKCSEGPGRCRPRRLHVCCPHRHGHRRAGAADTRGEARPRTCAQGLRAALRAPEPSGSTGSIACGASTCHPVRWVTGPPP